MVLRKTSSTPFGHYAFVFLVGDRAIKVFNRRQGQDGHVRDVFRSEVGAYEIACNNEDLKGLVPQFFGQVAPVRIEDIQGNDISDQFMLDCAYEMALVRGDFIKIGSPSCAEVRQMLLARFAQAKIQHVLDASVVFNADGTVRSVIDFALQEYPQEYPK